MECLKEKFINNPKSIPDEELIQLCINNYQDAWDEFVNRYNRLIYGKIHKTIELMNCYFIKDKVDDIFQEVFIKIVKTLDKLKARELIKIWISRITFTVTVDCIRREIKRKEAVVDEDISDIEYVCHKKENPIVVYVLEISLK